jgi:hypothetical protein
LPSRQALDGQSPLPFNLSHSGSGPLLNLLMVRRVLREGFEPRWIVVEVVPSLLGASGRSTASKLSQAGDLPTLQQYVNPLKLLGYYLSERLAAASNHRRAYLRAFLPNVLEQAPQWDCIPLESLGGNTTVVNQSPTAEETRRKTDVVRSEYCGGLQRLRIDEMPDRALRELLLLCREKQIQVALLLAPESAEFRSWYSEESLATAEEYCARLGREFDVPVIDARRWLSDESLADGHHAFAEGAREFTLRLDREVLRPMVEGRPLIAAGLRDTVR